MMLNGSMSISWWFYDDLRMIFTIIMWSSLNASVWCWYVSGIILGWFWYDFETIFIWVLGDFGMKSVWFLDDFFYSSMIVVEWSSDDVSVLMIFWCLWYDFQKISKLCWYDFRMILGWYWNDSGMRFVCLCNDSIIIYI